VILTTPSGGQQTVLLASQALRTAGNPATTSNAGVPTVSGVASTGVASGATAAAAAPAGNSGGTLVLQQAGGAQQILLPPGFNIKSLQGIQGLQGLQGLKVIPLATAQAAQGKGNMFELQRVFNILSSFR